LKNNEEKSGIDGFMTSSAMNWFNINRNIPIHGVINNFRMSGHFPVNFKIMHFSISGSITAWGHSDWGGTIPTSIGRIAPAKVVSYTMNGDISVDIGDQHCLSFLFVHIYLFF
jgi:hypothetical protein